MNRPLGLAAAVFTGVQIGLAMVATRALAGEVGPFTLAFLRYTVGALVLTPFFLRLSPAPLAPCDRLPVLGLGVLQFGVLVALLNAGLARVTAAEGAVIFSTFPILTLLLASALGVERLTAGRLSGAALSVVGVALCLGARDMPDDPWGVLMVVGAALAGAICAVAYRPYLQRYPTLQIGTLAMLAAIVALAPGALAEGSPASWTGFNLSTWGLVLFIGLSSGAGYLLWLTALRHADPGEATILLGLSPVTAALTGWALLGEPLTGTFLAGIALVLAGVSLAVLRRR